MPQTDYVTVDLNTPMNDFRHWMTLCEAAKPIIAYHGSPHDFAEFDIVNIGSGEGAQSYGYGMYFAESEAVARGYQQRLSPPSEWKISPDKIKPEFAELGFSEPAVERACRIDHLRWRWISRD